MLAAQINQYGGKEVLSISKEAPKPTLTNAQVLVEVKAASVNPFDWKLREGYMKEMIPLTFPATLGGDFSGVIIEVGQEVTSVKVGDEVFGGVNIVSGGSGSLAQFAVGKADMLALKPNNLDFTQAAALPLVGVSSYQVLVDHMKLAKGQKILIHGGAGGIGSTAIQLAKYLGAYVATTASNEDLGFVQNLGADKVIDYKKELFNEQIKDYDAVFDTVGGKTYTDSFLVLKKGGIIVSMVEQPNNELMQQYGVTAKIQFTRINTETLIKLSDLVEQKIITPRIDKIFPLDQAAAALEYLKTGHPNGKVIVTI